MHKLVSIMMARNTTNEVDEGTCKLHMTVMVQQLALAGTCILRLILHRPLHKLTDLGGIAGCLFFSLEVVELALLADCKTHLHNTAPHPAAFLKLDITAAMEAATQQMHTRVMTMHGHARILHKLTTQAWVQLLQPASGQTSYHVRHSSWGLVLFADATHDLLRLRTAPPAAIATVTKGTKHEKHAQPCN
jgi:hypothetical protein